MTLRAVIFDYGDTLLSTRMNWSRVIPENLAGLVAVLGAARLGLDLARLKRDFMFMRSEGQRLAREQCRETRATASLRSALALQGVGDVDEDLLQRGVDGYFQAEERNYSIIVGIPETLARLRALGLKLAVVSNATCPRLIRRALQTHGLLTAFDLLLVSAEVGICKPDPRVFEPVFEALAVDAEACAVVGDRLDTDIAGAREAGMRSVLADFLGDEMEPEPGQAMPHAVVRHPEALVSILESWMK